MTSGTNRRKFGHLLAFSALLALIAAFAWMSATMQGSPLQRIAGAAITLLPLLLFLRGTWHRHLRSFQGLALLAPVYLFIGGVVWLWADWRFGLWICIWSVALETGAILHNFQKRNRKK